MIATPPPTDNVAIRRPTAMVLTACGLFMAANVLVPFTLGDVYPFTLAPMFRDAPQSYCDYRVYDPSGALLSSDLFAVRRYYDGNPVGCGVGIKPPESLDEFGRVHEEEIVRRHIAKYLANEPELPYVEVEQEIVGPVDELRVGVLKTHRWRIAREATKRVEP